MEECLLGLLGGEDMSGEGSERVSGWEGLEPMWVRMGSDLGNQKPRDSVMPDI